MSSLTGDKHSLRGYSDNIQLSKYFCKTKKYLVTLPLKRFYVGAWLGVFDLSDNFYVLINEPHDNKQSSYILLKNVSRFDLYTIINDLSQNLPDKDLLNQPEEIVLLTTDFLRSIIQSKLILLCRVLYVI
jgi:hypothetical protein